LKTDEHASTVVNVDASKVTHQLNPLHMGCHSDSGFAHQPRGFYSQLLYGESFEFGNASSWDYKSSIDWYDYHPTAIDIKWNTLMTEQAAGSIRYDSGVFAHHGYTSLRAEYSTEGKGGIVAATNRGIGNEGLYLLSGKDYEGYFFAKSELPTNVTVMLRNYLEGTIMASASIMVNSPSSWTQYNFSMTVSSSVKNATCEGIAADSDPQISCHLGNSSITTDPQNAHQGHVCVRCAGEFAIGLTAPGVVHVDYVMLQPGRWGRYGEGPFLRTGVETLKEMGITAIRLGGSFSTASYYFWKDWHGRPWERPSLGAKWGSDLISGFGPFEFVQMCEEAGIEPIVTTAAQQPPPSTSQIFGGGINVPCCSAEDMADLIEYIGGNSSTAWGRQRAADGHPEPYKLRFVELGNEQLNTAFPAQVKAMEARAVKIGMPKHFYYISPNNAQWLNASQAAEVETLGLGDHVLSDMHVGSTGGVEAAQTLFGKFPGKDFAAGNAETNGGHHTMQRASEEAADLNAWFDCWSIDRTGAFCQRLKFRTASFCSERSGHLDDWDQGISMFLPNASWLQPPGYLHKMVTETMQPNGLEVVISKSWRAANLSASAQQSDDGKTLVVRLANVGTREVTLSLNVSGAARLGDAAAATMWLLASPSGDRLDANTPAEPTRVSPVRTTIRRGGGLTLPAASAAVVVMGARRRTAPLLKADDEEATACPHQHGVFDWIRKIAAGPPGQTYALGAEVYMIDRQYQLPGGTELRGAGTAPGRRTEIKACGEPYTACAGAASAPGSVQGRKGLLLGDDTYVSGLHMVGMETKRIDCLYAMIETPGCQNSEGNFRAPPDETGPCGPAGRNLNCCGGYTGNDGHGVSNATVEDVTVEGYTTQNMFFMAPTAASKRVSRDITVRNMRMNGSWADGVNIHGQHANVLVEGSTVIDSGDDNFATWSIGVG
jgi:alpha-L-arabinofuranosidase